MFGPQAEGTLNGMPIVPNLFLTAESGSKAELVVMAGYESITVLLSPTLLEKHLFDRQHRDTFRLPHGIEMLHTQEANARSLFDWGKRLANTAALNPELFNDHKDTLAAVQTEVLEMLLAAIDTTTVPRHTRSDHTRQAHTRVVRRAEDYALKHTEGRLSVTDLCVATGVSERMLQYSFQEVIGMSPLAYLTRLSCIGFGRSCGQGLTDRPRYRSRRSDGTFGISAIFSAPTSIASVSCRRNHCDKNQKGQLFGSVKATNLTPVCPLLPGILNVQDQRPALLAWAR